MARTKLVSRNKYNWRKAAQFCAAPVVATPAKIENKNIANKRIRNRRFKLKKILSQFKNVQVKEHGSVIRGMVVWCKRMYPGYSKLFLEDLPKYIPESLTLHFFWIIS